MSNHRGDAVYDVALPLMRVCQYTIMRVTNPTTCVSTTYIACAFYL